MTPGIRIDPSMGLSEGNQTSTNLSREASVWYSWFRLKREITTAPDLPLISPTCLDPRLSLMATAVILLLGTPSGLISQEVGALVIRSHADHPELSEPAGYGAFASVPMGRWLQVRVAYDKVSQDFRGEAEVCAHYGPNLGCWMELATGSTSLGNLDVALVPTFSLGRVFRAGVGGGISFSTVTASRTGESGRTANLEAPKTGQLGYLTLLTLGVTPVPGLPFTLAGGVASHWVNFKACVSYEEVYAPFCGRTLFQEVYAGMALRF
jgi:hypothetical protein